jgi:hypothetical protein
MNAALDHKALLCDLFKDSHLPNKTTGFYWDSTGISGAKGEELTVSLDKERKDG